MTLFIDPATLTYPVSVQHLRRMHPDVSYPEEPTDADYLAAGCEVVVPVEPPPPKPGFQLVELPPVQTGPHAWKQVWTEIPLPMPDAAPVILMSSQSLKVSQAKSLNAQGRTAEAVDLLIKLVEQKL
jgi:hypothetical protein